MNEHNIAYYNDNAQRLAQEYNSVDLEKALSALAAGLDRYKGKEKSALDLGCGAGGDAFWLANKGWRVDAIDGSTGMLEEAKKHKSHDKITYHHAIAPDLSGLELSDPYNLVTMTAFIFHFDREDRQKIFDYAANRLGQNGLIHISLRMGETAPGRIMYPANTDEIADYAKLYGLKFKSHGEKDDDLGRRYTRWSYVSAWRGDAWDHMGDLTI